MLEVQGHICVALAPQCMLQEVEERGARRGRARQVWGSCCPVVYITVPHGMFEITLIHVNTVYLRGTLDSDLCPGSHTDLEKCQQSIYIFDERALCFQSQQVWGSVTF